MLVLCEIDSGFSIEYPRPGVADTATENTPLRDLYNNRPALPTRLNQRLIHLVQAPRPILRSSRTPSSKSFCRDRTRHRGRGRVAPCATRTIGQDGEGS